MRRGVPERAWRGVAGRGAVPAVVSLAVVSLMGGGCISERAASPELLSGLGGRPGVIASATEVEAAGPVRRPVSRPAVAGAVEGDRGGEASRAADDIWPARWGDAGDPLNKGVIVPAELPRAAYRGVTLGRDHRLRAGPLDFEDLEALAAGRVGAAGWDYRLEGGRSFVFRRDRSVEADPGAERGPAEPFAVFRFVSGRVAEVGPGGRPVVEVTRSWFAQYDAAPGWADGAGGAGGPTRGLVVVLPGLYGVPGPVINALVQQFRREGWSVLRMLAPNSRLTSYERLEIAVGGEGERPEVSAAAAALDERLAEQAYAAGSGAAHALGLRPGLAGLPVVMIGGSAGAISLPAAAAWTERVLGRPIDGAVLIAGGADVLTISERSAYARWIDAADFVWLDGRGREIATPDAETLARASRAYLRASKLDGYHLAPRLRGVPTLAFYGTRDSVVPTATGELLWRRLGEPERWTIASDHDLIFLGLWTWGPRILAWIDENVAAGPGQGAAGGGGAGGPGGGGP